MRVRCARRQADAERLRDHRLHRQPVDRRTRALAWLGAAGIHREAYRYLARDDQLGEQRVAAAHVRPHLGEGVEEFHAARFAPLPDDAGEPHDIARLQADAALPFRVEETFVRSGQLVATHQSRVVGDAEVREAVGHPGAMRWYRCRPEVRYMRAVELGEDLLARDFLEVRADGLDGVDLVAVGARLRDRALRGLLPVGGAE